MAGNRTLNIGPAPLTTTMTTNLLNTGTGAMSTPPVGYVDMNRYIILRHIVVVNKDSASHTVSMWKGVSSTNAAGKEFLFQGTTVPANSKIEATGIFRFDAADFLVGGCVDANSVLTWEAEGEIGCAG
jgi:hypothetical protein